MNVIEFPTGTDTLEDALVDLCGTSVATITVHTDGKLIIEPRFRLVAAILFPTAKFCA